MPGHMARAFRVAMPHTDTPHQIIPRMPLWIRVRMGHTAQVHVELHAAAQLQSKHAVDSHRG